MNRKKKILFATIGIFVILFAIIGITYAYFVARVQGNTNTVSISTKAGILSLVYGEGQNDVIEATNILPGYTNTKNFTVTNNGTGTASYGVFLEDLRNTFTRTSDLKLTITCTSNISGNTCNGFSQSDFPTQNRLLLTNEIEKNEVQTYTLTFEYLNVDTNQNADNNASLFAKVQIYDLDSTVDLEGTVTNSESGDYVVVNSSPKRSEIVNGTFKVVGLEPGNHTINIYNESETQKSTSSLSITLGATNNITNNNITITESSRLITTTVDAGNGNIMVSNITDYVSNQGQNNNNNNNENGNNNNNDENVEKITVNPFSGSTTLAYNILQNAIEEKNGTEALTNPRTLVGKETSEYGTGEYDEVNYADIMEYEGDSLYISDSQNDDQYYYSQSYSNNSCTNELIGKYAYNSSKSVSGAEVVGCNDGAFILNMEKKVSEKTLSIAQDDYGNTYYFRGDVTDNYVTFAGKCWRIIRIEGDGSIKLILEDNDQVRSSSIDYNWNIPIVTNGEIYTGNFGIDELSTNKDGVNVYSANYLNPKTEADKSQIYAYYNFQNSLSSNDLAKLKTDNWCLGDLESAYSYPDSPTANIEKLNDTIENLKYNGTRFSYENNFKLIFDIENALKCRNNTVNKFNDVTYNGNKIISSSDMKVGALYAAEPIYLGTAPSVPNENTFISNSYNNYSSFFTSSLAYFSTWGINSMYYDIIFFIDVSHGMGVSEVYGGYSTNAFRPVVVLNAGTTISSGDGTINNPYVIN